MEHLNPFVDARFSSSRLVKRVDDEHFEGFPHREAPLVSSRVCDKENPLRILLLLDFLLNWRIQRRDVGCVEIEHRGKGVVVVDDEDAGCWMLDVVVDVDVGCWMLDDGADDSSKARLNACCDVLVRIGLNLYFFFEEAVVVVVDDVGCWILDVVVIDVDVGCWMLDEGTDD